MIFSGRILWGIWKPHWKWEKLDHKILLEPLTHFETNVCTSANDLTEILDRIQSSYLVGMCDIAVPFVEREPVIDYVIKLGSRMQHLHLVDSNGIDETHLLPGEGKILMPELLAELKKHGHGCISTQQRGCTGIVRTV